MMLICETARVHAAVFLHIWVVAWCMFVLVFEVPRGHWVVCARVMASVCACLAEPLLPQVPVVQLRHIVDLIPPTVQQFFNPLTFF